jgi:tetratricopeptide (TPR) repeat protein
MSQDTSEKPVTPEPETGSGDPMESLFSYMVGSWKELLTGLIIAAIIVGSVMLYQRKARLSREQSFTQLSVAGSPAQLNEIVRQFPSSKAAELASFMAARAQYDSGNYAEADQIYTDFLKKYPKHFLAPATALGHIHCQEAVGQVDEALAAFQRFTKDNPSEKALVTVARLGEARCLRQLGKLQDAVAVYETLLLELPESEWQPLIEDLKNTTTRDLERMNKPMNPASAPAI